MIADNDLELNALEDLTEMSLVTPHDRLSIVVLADRSTDYVSGPVVGVDDWTTARLLLIEGERAVVLDDLGEIDMGDPAHLRDFVTTGITDFPAANYALILWDHGATLFGMGPDMDPGILGVIGLADTATAIREALDAVGVDRLDLIGFDACLMGSLETAVAMAPVAGHLLASEEYEPAVGWDWTALEYLAIEPNPTVEGLGIAIIDAYSDHPVIRAYPDHTLSLIDLDRIGAVEEAVGDLVEAMVADMDAYAGMLGRQRNKVVEFGRNPDPWSALHMVDLGHLALRLANRDPSLTDPASAVRRAVDAAVVYMANGEGAADATGLAVFFPGVPEYWEAARPYYSRVPETPWHGLLDGFFAAGRAIPPTRHPSFEPVGATARTEFQEPAGLLVSADFSGATTDDIADVRLLLGLPVPGGAVYYSDYGGEVVGTTAEALHGLEALYLDDRGRFGEEAVYGGAPLVFHRLTTIESAAGMTVTVEVPLAYFPAGSDPTGDDYLGAVLIDSYVFDAATGEWTSGKSLYLTNESGTVGSVIPDPAGLLVPLLLHDLGEGDPVWLPDDSGTTLAADVDALTMTIWTWGFPGTELVVQLRVADYGGNSATAAALTRVPSDWATAVG
jgi:hypothetical protein